MRIPAGCPVVCGVWMAVCASVLPTEFATVFRSQSPGGCLVSLYACMALFYVPVLLSYQTHLPHIYTEAQQLAPVMTATAVGL